MTQHTAYSIPHSIQHTAQYSTQRTASSIQHPAHSTASDLDDPLGASLIGVPTRIRAFFTLSFSARSALIRCFIASLSSLSSASALLASWALLMADRLTGLLPAGVEVISEGANCSGEEVISEGEVVIAVVRWRLLRVLIAVVRR